MHCALDCRMVVCAVLPLIVWVVCVCVCTCMCVCACLCMYIHVYVWGCTCVGVLWVWCVHAYACCVCVCVGGGGALVLCVCVRERGRWILFHSILHACTYQMLFKGKNNCNVCPIDTLVQVCWGTVQFCHLCCEVIPSLLFILGRKKVRILTEIFVFNKMNFHHQLFCYLWLAHIMTRWILCVHSQHIHTHTLTRMHTCNTHTCMHTHNTHVRTHTKTHAHITHTHTHTIIHMYMMQIWPCTPALSTHSDAVTHISSYACLLFCTLELLFPLPVSVSGLSLPLSGCYSVTRPHTHTHTHTHTYTVHTHTHTHPHKPTES